MIKLTVMSKLHPFKCPAAPYEAALLNAYFRDRIKMARFSLSQSLNNACCRPAMGQAVVSLLNMSGIQYMGLQFKTVKADKKN